METVSTNEPTALHMLVQFLPFIFLSFTYCLTLGAVSGILAHKKGYSVALFIICSLIPLVGIPFLLFIVGAPDKVLHKKIDSLLKES
jgi:hypothetical protein